MVAASSTREVRIERRDHGGQDGAEHAGSIAPASAPPATGRYCGLRADDPDLDRDALGEVGVEDDVPGAGDAIDVGPIWPPMISPSWLLTRLPVPPVATPPLLQVLEATTVLVRGAGHGAVEDLHLEAGDRARAAAAGALLREQLPHRRDAGHEAGRRPRRWRRRTTRCTGRRRPWRRSCRTTTAPIQVRPRGPSGPAGPVSPVCPRGPAGPCGPDGPIGPAAPAAPAGPSRPDAAGADGLREARLQRVHPLASAGHLDRERPHLAGEHLGLLGEHLQLLGELRRHRGPARLLGVGADAPACRPPAPNRRRQRWRATRW